MKTRPIIFNTDMVKAIRRGQKRQTRRPIKAPFEVHRWGSRVTLTRPDRFGGRFDPYSCAYGQPGDRLWVRETFARHPPSNEIAYRADGEEFPYGDGFDWKPKWTPAIHMPRSVARIFLEITSVRVEQVQDIRGIEAIMEASPGQATPLENFHKAWDSLYAKRGLGWDANPWVWVISFKHIEEGQ